MAKKKEVRTGNQQKTAELKTNRTLGLEVVHPQAAGIDVGNGMHYVAVPPHLDESPVRMFGMFHFGFEALADWLVQLKVTTVALQSTGVYWIPLYDMLTEREVLGCLWSMPGTPRTCRAAKATCKNVNGF